MRPGRFKALEGWGQNALLAVDGNDRLWVGVVGKTPVNSKSGHYRPCIMRLDSDFFHPDNPGVITQSTQGMGLHFDIENGLPFGTSLRPVAHHVYARGQAQQPLRQKREREPGSSTIFLRMRSPRARSPCRSRIAPGARLMP